MSETRHTRKRRKKRFRTGGAWNPAPRELKDLLTITSPDICITLFRLQNPSTFCVTFNSHLPLSSKRLGRNFVLKL